MACSMIAVILGVTCVIWRVEVVYAFQSCSRRERRAHGKVTDGQIGMRDRPKDIT